MCLSVSGPRFDSVESFFFFVPPLFSPLLSPGMGSIPTRSQFFYITLFLFFPSFFPRLYFFPHLFLSSSNFFLPFSPACLPSFFLSPILFPLLFLFPFFSSPFCCFSFSLSSNNYSISNWFTHVRVRKS